jgi:hypothetical protein
MFAPPYLRRPSVLACAVLCQAISSVDAELVPKLGAWPSSNRSTLLRRFRTIPPAVLASALSDADGSVELCTDKLVEQRYCTALQRFNRFGCV